MPSQSQSPPYRPDIDGLRALAVLAVVIFHAFPTLLPGGFIGVDVFFVVSGFLITNIILKGLEQGTFSFIQFYARRVRRIFPALILVLCACFAFGWFALLPNEYKQLGKHIAASSAFVSNFMFWQEAGYFDNAADTKPLLHLWSLGIEEQFYIVWPVLVWALFRWRLNILTFTIIAFIASLAYSGVIVHQADLVKDFYSPLTRFWELLIGALLAYATSMPKLRALLCHGLSTILFAGQAQNTAYRLRQLSSIVGLLLLIGGLIFINRETAFPGYWALLLTLGALCLIGAGPHALINRYLLSNRLLVGIGLISYPLYLWHWPLLSFAKIIEGVTPSWKVKLTLMVVALILSIASYWLIEKPIRFGKHQKSKTIVLVMVMTIIGYIGYNTYVRDGLGFRFPKLLAEIVTLNYNFRPDFRASSCFLDENQVFEDFSKCSSNNIIPSKRLVLLWGDSHAAHLYQGMLSRYGNDFNIVQMTSSGCPPIIGLNMDNMSGGDKRKNCKAINDKTYKWVLINKPNFIFLASTWGQEVYRREVFNTILKLREDTKSKVILVGPAPQWIDSLPRLLYRNYTSNPFKNIPEKMKFGVNQDIFKFDDELSLQAKKNSIFYISLTKIMCDEQGCITRVGDDAKELMSFDYGHLTRKGSIYVISKFPELK